MGYIDILKTVMPYFGVFAVGFVLKRGFALPPQADKFLFRLFIHLFFPCLVVNFITGNENLRDISSSLSLPLWGMLSVASGFAAAYFLAPFIGLNESKERRSFAFSTGVYNYGFFTLPVIMHLFGRDAAGQLLLFNFGIDFIYWTAGIMILTGSYKAGVVKLASSTPVYALILSVAFNSLFSPEPIGGTAGRVLDAVSFLTMPLGLFVSGLALGEGLRGASLAGTFRIGAAGILLRMVGMAFIFLLAAKYAVNDRGLRIILAAQSAMPAGMMNLAMVKYYMGETRVTSAVIVFTIAASLVSMPFWLEFAFRFVGV
ncbi:MAG: AEC family transporter [Deferribacterales bacterium]